MNSPEYTMIHNIFVFVSINSHICNNSKPSTDFKSVVEYDHVQSNEHPCINTHTQSNNAVCKIRPQFIDWIKK